jgi:uncharacterized protein
MSMKAVVLYESAENVMENAPLHFAAHSARLDEYHRRGTLLVVARHEIRDWNEMLAG